MAGLGPFNGTNFLSPLKIQMQIPGFSDFLMLITGIIHSDSPKHPVWWPQSRVLTVAKISLGWIKLRLVGSSLKTGTFFEGVKPPPETADVVTLIQPTPVMKMFAKSR